MISEEQWKAAAKEAGEALLDSLPPEDQCTHDFSPQFERRMKGLLKKERHSAARRALSRAAGLLLALLAAGSVWLAADTEARGVAAGWFRQAYENVFIYRFAGPAQSTDKNVKYAPTWLPEGTAEIDAWQDDTGGTIVYQDINGQLCFFSYYMDPGSAPAIITNAKITTITTEKLIGDYYNAEGLDESSGFIWEDQENGVLFMVFAYFSQDDFVKIAENIMVKKIMKNNVHFWLTSSF